MLTARMVIRNSVTSSALAQFWEGFSSVFISGCSMLFADDAFGGLDVLADTRPAGNGSGSFPREPDDFDVLRPIIGCDGILIPGAGNGVSLKDIELDQSATGNQNSGAAIAGRADKLLQRRIEPVGNRNTIPIDNAETVALDVGDQLGLPNLFRQGVHGRAIDLVQFGVIGQGSKAASAHQVKGAYGRRGHAEQSGGDQHFEDRKSPFEFLPQPNRHNSESHLSRYR